MRLPGLASSRRPLGRHLGRPLGRIVTMIAHRTRLQGNRNAALLTAWALPTCPVLARRLCRPVLCTSPVCHLPGPPTASLAVRGGFQPGAGSWPTDLLRAEKGDLGATLSNGTKSGEWFPWGWLLQSSTRMDFGVLVSFCS